MTLVPDTSTAAMLSAALGQNASQSMAASASRKQRPTGSTSSA